MAVDQQGLYQSVVEMYSMVHDELGGRYQPFLNYGFAKNPSISLDQKDEPFDVYANLYHYVCNQVDVRNKEVLEIGSGRGGGSYYIKSYLDASSVIGVEYLKQSVEVSNKSFEHVLNLSFQQGDAQDLKFQDDVVDVVVNIESSHCYPDLERFFQEVSRVLRHRGHFCYADLMTLEMKARVESLIPTLPLNLLNAEDISDGVIGGLSLANSRKFDLINSMNLSDERRQWWINEWACVGTQIWHELKAGDLIYMHYVFRKR